MQDILKVIEIKDGFRLIFNGLEIFKHEKKDPIISIGSGTNNIRNHKRHHGNFKIDEEVQEIYVLEDFNITQDDKNKIEVKFTDKTQKLVLNFNASIVEERLMVRFRFSNNDDEYSNEISGKYNRFRINLIGKKDEHIYGCGEQLSRLDLKGSKVPLWCQEPGFGRDRSLASRLADIFMWGGGDWYTTYYPQSTYVSSANYFVHIESYAYAEMDFRSECHSSLYFWEIPKRIVIDVQSNALELLSSLSNLLGKQPMLPDWATDGVWLGIGGGLDDTKSWSIQQKLKRAREADVKVSTIWSQDWCGLYNPSKFEMRVFWNWKYDKKRYPNLPEYINSLNEDGIKFLGYNNCFLNKEGELYKEAAKHGYLIENESGEPYDIIMIFFKVGMVDLTNPDAWKWMKNLIIRNMINIGLNGWMCDFAEYMPIDCVLHSGEDPIIHHNEYPVLWAKLNYEAVKEATNGDANNIVFFNRSGNVGSTKYVPLMWSGDQMVNFSKGDGLPTVINGGLSMGFVGIGYYHSDIGGLSSALWLKRSKEVFMRWTEMATFTCVMRTHEGHQYKGGNNWTYDSDVETLRHFSKFSRIHSHLHQYTIRLIQEYQQHGLPLIRHPYIHYENDHILHELHYQYLYGRDILVAPVIEKGKTKWNVYLPEDQWEHIWSGQSFNGGWIEIDAPVGKPPVFFRKSSEFRHLFREIKDIE
ncbi:MAG: alpha-glucosidase [Candidatus Lokiarchaeota archaeon]|nr:alpha-glucosidase [Candidatus Lokiarchaeota archaeon]